MGVKRRKKAEEETERTVTGDQCSVSPNLLEIIRLCRKEWRERIRRQYTSNFRVVCTSPLPRVTYQNSVPEARRCSTLPCCAWVVQIKGGASMPSPFANRHAHAGLQMLTSFFTRMTKEEKKPSIDRSMATSLRRLQLLVPLLTYHPTNHDALLLHVARCMFLRVIT
jgi:hypothetical protein